MDNLKVRFSWNHEKNDLYYFGFWDGDLEISSGLIQIQINNNIDKSKIYDKVVSEYKIAKGI